MLKFILKTFLFLLTFISIVLILPGNILLDIEPKVLEIALPESFSGPLSPNERLSNAKKLFENQLFGPESIAHFEGKLVTGCADGFLYQIDGNKVKPLLKLVEKSCATHALKTSKCGRPLGLKFDSMGTLFVVEPNVGVFSVQNIFGKNPSVNLVLDIDDTSILGKTSKLFDDLAIDEGAGFNGGHVLYITDISVKFEFNQLIYSHLGHDLGRLIKYDINNKKFESISENLLFPNGIELTDDKNALIFTETLLRSVKKIYIKGIKKGETEILIKSLPGEPDNIRRSASEKETYWLALLNPRNASNPYPFVYFLSKPLMKKLIVRVIHIFGSVIQFVGNIFNNDLIEEFGFNTKNGKLFWNLIAYHRSFPLIIHLDKDGNILESLQSSDSTFAVLSEIKEVKLNDQESVLHLGSAFNNYLGKITLKHTLK